MQTLTRIDKIVIEDIDMTLTYENMYWMIPAHLLSNLALDLRTLNNCTFTFTSKFLIAF